MSLKHLFVPLEIARQLKEKGFNEECFYHWYVVPEGYTDEPRLLGNGGKRGVNQNEDLNILQFSAPTYQQVQDWFRDKYEMEVTTEVEFLNKYNFAVYNLSDSKEGVKGFNPKPYYDAFKEAIELGIRVIS